MTIIGTVFEANNLSELAGIQHGFFSREGGVSGGVYGSLNCGYGSNDDREAVTENRRRVATHLVARADMPSMHLGSQPELPSTPSNPAGGATGSRPSSQCLGPSTPSNPAGGATYDEVVTVYQVHSAEAVIVDGPFAADAVPKADAVVTATRGVAVGALTADCTPILFADPVAGVIAAAHAGWRGAVDGILASTVTAMETLGAHREAIRAAVGPTIHQSAYEVGPEFEAEFLRRSPDNSSFFMREASKDRSHFDLPGFCISQLQDIGVGSTTTIGRCTYENESLFFSYRRKTHLNEVDYGRQISAIVLL